ncbi:MAG: hypothetical protein HY248_07025, partial [Fimbriimonas ginsengisoli]|nr:hypothetical protein [Fimbriimonas ginsengisoli]
MPALKKDERRVAVFLRSRDVTSFLRGDVLTVPGDDGSAIPQVFIDAPTGMQVKRSALGAEGLVLDHLNRAAVQRYLAQVVTPLTGAGPADSVFCDSLEVYGANWTRRYPDAFASRRGYDLKAFLPQLFDRASAAGADLRFDFWRTHAELVEDQFIRTVHDWAQRHRVRFEMEAYGTPPCPLTSARFIVEPVGEQYEWKGFSLSRLAASGAHLAGRRIIGAEAWTWLGIPNRLADSLSDLKLASDLHFLAGVNDLIGVAFAYSPRSAGAPGWMPYYGPVLNQNNPQWPWFRHLVDYTSRCQWLLRRGRPVADVALYLPVEDTFADGPVDQMVLGLRLRDRLAPGAKKGEFGLEAALQHHSNVIHGLISHGFDYDGIDFFAMNQLARVRAGRLEAGDGA